MGWAEDTLAHAYILYIVPFSGYRRFGAEQRRDDGMEIHRSRKGKKRLFVDIHMERVLFSEQATERPYCIANDLWTDMEERARANRVQQMQPTGEGARGITNL